ncbi:MAG: DUF4331 family protein [Sphingomicrobium sp.]|nr:DUF4331 domain-containing protein [Sphingomonadales bacterium]
MMISIVLAATAGPAMASDHIDSPRIAQDRGSDLADTYAFVDPNDRSKVVLMMSTQDFIVSGEHFGMPIFDSNIRYRFEIENSGDAKPDTYVDVYFAPGLGREMPQKARIQLPNGQSFEAWTTPSTQEYRAPEFVVTTDPKSGVSFYAGNADDPFFLDDTGANRLVGSIVKGRPNKSLLGERGGRDTYAGFNTLITAVEIPAAMLLGRNGTTIGVNAVTQRRRAQTIGDNGRLETSGDWVTIDRDGNPLVNNGLIPAARKDEYNSASTEDDARGRFRDDIVKSLRTAGTDEPHIAMLLDAVANKGDILRLNVAIPNRGPGGGNNPDGGFGKMGGRRLQDDVVDMTFKIINNGRPLSDHVDRNEVAFGNVFPFVAKPHQPFPPRSGPDDLTRQ